MTDESVFQRLCQAQIEGSASEQEQKHLNDLLNVSEELRQSYVEQMRIHAFLSWQHGHTKLRSPSVENEGKIVRWSFTARAMAEAAAVLVFAGVFALWQYRGDRDPVSIEIVASSNLAYRVGERVERRHLEIQDGTFSFRLASGAVVDVEGAASLDLVSPVHLLVLRGQVTADISDGEKGFVIETAQARVVDLGTRFSVSVDSRDGTDVVVFEGEVEVFDPSGKSSVQRPKITLTEGEAVRVDQSLRSNRLRMIPLGKDARSMQAGTDGGIVTDVHDNVPENDFRGYYGLLRGAVKEGARVYTTGHTRTWHSMLGGIFPKELEDADGICTFGMDRSAANLQITLEISRPCNLFVMVDARTPVPDWLQREFVDTGHRLRSGPWIPRDTPPEDFSHFTSNEAAYVPYAVWSKRIATPGPVVLGSPMSGESIGKPVMYGLAVKDIR